ncbi:MAG: serine/threonine protein kinase, partial [Thermogutta sp.]|nr:serine/threonine protein kinase [Thermogutta sp.]
MATDWTAEKTAERALELGLISDWDLRRIWSELGRRNVPLDEFLQFLVRREYLTNYQIEKLLKGDRDGFFYGDYKVMYLVGAGSFARVFRAVNQTNNQVVALKVLRKRYSENPECYRQFLREGQLGMVLRHPNIVPVYEVSSYNGSYYLVMEFVEGQNLREFLKIRKKLEPLEATRIMIDVLSGLDYAYRQGLTHRDLKLSNVLISSEGTAKLV